MSGTAIFCSGQGGKGPRMFDLVATEAAAAPVFAAAAAVLGRDPRDLAASGDDLYRNAVAQVLCCTAALAAWAVVGTAVARPLTVAGYSVGEVPAWAVAGVIDAPATFDLVARRAALMDRETREPAGLAAILGLPRPAVDALCRDHRLAVAIVNGPLHVVVGGAAADIDAALGEAPSRGATRAVRLPVHVAAHTPALARASTDFGAVLAGIAATAPRVGEVRLLSGVDGAPVRDLAAGRAKLAAQVSTTVDWAACMEACRAVRPSRILELGPGDALARMMAEVAPGLPVRSVSQFRTIEGLRQWLAVP